MYFKEIGKLLLGHYWESKKLCFGTMVSLVDLIIAGVTDTDLLLDAILGDDGGLGGALLAHDVTTRTAVVLKHRTTVGG